MTTNDVSTVVIAPSMDYLPPPDPKAVEQAMLIGDISQMTDEQRISYYVATCRSLNLNPLTRPFMAIKGDDGKMSLYPDKGCAEQLRKLHRVSCKVVGREFLDDLYIVTVRASTPDGREEEAQGAVPMAKAKGTWKETSGGKRYFQTEVGADGKEVTVPLTVAERATSIMRAECVPLESEILTRDGWKTYDQVCIGEEVLAYDVPNDVCQWTPLLDVTVHERLPMARLFAPKGKFEVFCTPNHSWAVRRSVPYKPTRRYDGSRGPRGPIASRGPMRALVETQHLKTSHHLVLAAVLQDTEPSLLQPVEAAILGWAVTDGTIKRVGNSVRIGICQSKEQHFTPIRELVAAVAPETRELITPAGSRTFPTGRTYATRPQHWWYLPSALSRLILQRAGFTSVEDLPRIVTRLDHPARQAMLQAMMLAEGDEKRVFANTKRAVMDAFQLLATLEGAGLGLERNRPGIFEQAKKLSRHTAVSFLAVERVDDAPAWCPTTAYGTWVMRQGRRIMITGNTKAKRRVTLAICGLGMADWEQEPTSAAHPMALNLQTPPAPTETHTLAEHIEDLFGPPQPPPGAADDVLPSRTQVEDAIRAQPGGDVERWMVWAERTLLKKARHLFTVEDYQRLLQSVQAVAKQKGVPHRQDSPQEPAEATQAGQEGSEDVPATDERLDHPERPAARDDESGG